MHTYFLCFVEVSSQVIDVRTFGCRYFLGRMPRMPRRRSLDKSQDERLRMGDGTSCGGRNVSMVQTSFHREIQMVSGMRIP